MHKNFVDIVARSGLVLLGVMWVSTPIAEPSPSAFGKWRVVAHRQPGIAAMSPEAADKWVGTRAEYSRSVARFGKERCSTPTYVANHLDVARFMEQFQLAPADLGIVSQPVEVIEIQCNGHWVAPGALIIVKGPKQLLTIWDGVFFEMQPK